ncbi:DUF2712 domain-containing protein [Cellulosilyticum ruminicola]|uniref:DUF2712 domain-containing protein n=1 Tax=Cellulosilyticum ruminicola TaxID=425254 RepID=UPI0006D0591A|nr:DUF2712 domain-containing protein [Cellulosilyticum ruminicola]
MNLKKIVSSSIIIAGVASMLTVGVNANNHSDSSFSFNLGLFKTSSTTTYRGKEDNTSAYINCTSVSTSDGEFDVYVLGPSGADRTWGTPKTVRQGTETYLENSVYESGERKAALKGVRESWRSGFTASGLWSPDSI